MARAILPFELTAPSPPRAEFEYSNDFGKTWHPMRRKQVDSVLERFCTPSKNIDWFWDTPEATLRLDRRGEHFVRRTPRKGQLEAAARQPSLF